MIDLEKSVPKIGRDSTLQHIDDLALKIEVLSERLYKSDNRSALLEQITKLVQERVALKAKTRRAYVLAAHPSTSLENKGLPRRRRSTSIDSGPTSYRLRRKRALKAAQ